MLLAVHFALAARVEVKTSLDNPFDGWGDVARANTLGREKKNDEALSFLKELRASRSGSTIVDERQSVDMAEFVFLRHDFPKNKERCLQCLKSAYAAGPTTFWGWAAYTLLKDLGVDVPMPPKDPLRGLGKFGDGVVNLEPVFLCAENRGPLVRTTAKHLLANEKAKFDAAKVKPADLKAGSRVRRAILRARLVESCTAEKIDSLLAIKGGKALFSRLWNDDAALEDFLLSGPAFDAPLALETLMTLYLNDANGDAKSGMPSIRWTQTETGRRATIAVALNARSGDDLAATVRHWAAFRRIGLWERFVSEAAKRDCREWRFIVRRPIDPADILYLNSTEKFPTKRRLNVGRFGRLRVPYRETNCFGVSKWAKNDEFLRPWTVSGLPRQYLRTRVGGVCTEQSMWAALCANAHGIMSERAGQPAHCAWLIREENGDWKIISNIKRYTAGVFLLWGRGFQYIQSTERAFADRAAFDESELLRFLGRPVEAIQRCPYSYSAWRDWTDGLKAKDASPEEWRGYLDELLDKCPDGRLVTWDFAWEAIEAMAGKGMDEKSLAKATAKVFKSLPQPKRWIAEEMNYEKDAIHRFLGRFDKNDALILRILAIALSVNGENHDYLTRIFSYALGRWSKDAKKMHEFLRISSAISGSGKMDWRRISTLKGVNEDRAIFRSIAEFRNKSDPPKGSLKVPERDFRADLVSGDALVRISSSGRDDRPEDHARVSDATPYDSNREGNFATGEEESAWAVVELAGETEIKGIMVVGDVSKLKVWTSLDAEEWTPVKVPSTASRNLRIDLNGISPEARFVKVGREGGAKSVLSLKKILVYGKKLY